MLVLCTCFFFNDTATTEIYTLSLHDALPISRRWTTSAAFERPERSSARRCGKAGSGLRRRSMPARRIIPCLDVRSEEHTSELQSRQYLVCRLLLEKKKNTQSHHCVRNLT